MLIYFWERESATGEGQRERKREKQRIQSQLHADARKPDAGLKLMNLEIMTWAEVRRSTNWATQAPLNKMFLQV